MKVHLITKDIQLGKHKFLVEQNDLLVASDMLEGFPYLQEFLKHAIITVSGCWFEKAEGNGKKYHLYREEDGKTVCGKNIKPILEIKMNLEVSTQEVCKTCAKRWSYRWSYNFYRDSFSKPTIILNEE